ncbi:YceI family protein [Rhodanobacter sp. Si-c]|uniref:YceI family protein n=1 Tax=Rhodanobacter lycopersici TaxID=3162487 RepID=A0ABV3QEG4_9GAMM
MPRAHPTRWLSLLLAVPAMAAFAGTHEYRYDTVHSQIVFSIDHNGYSRPFGRLHIARGWLRLDPDDLSHAGTELDIDLAGVDMGDAGWNAAVCGHALLDCAQYREAHFVSRSVERTDSSHGVLHGTLTLHGVSRPLAIPFRLNRVARTLYGLHTVAGFSATASLDRTDFGITAFPDSIGHRVSVWMELEAIRDDHAPTSASTTKGSP